MKKVIKNGVKKVEAKTVSPWVSVGIVVMVLLFVLAIAIKINRNDDMERSKRERLMNKVEEIREIKRGMKNR